ncbi:hypothetical protein ACFXHA_36270 [Nocardia sp. NPDC059240]|uniref:hypothetical protein n=1 Tax=Nocardia sp. NPDC059240 TaxID=3346786 RepID=UPI00367FDB44
MSILPPSDPQKSRLYPDWVRQFDPGVADSAETLTTSLSDEFRKTHKPGAFVDGMGWRVKDLPESHRPWVWDMAGHWLSARADDSPWGRKFRTAAGSAYGRARAAEREHALPVLVDFHRDNALLFARAGTLPVKEVAVHQRWLGTIGSAQDAHREFARLLVAMSVGGAALGADLARRVRTSAQAAGLGLDEDARVLIEVLGSCRSAKVPDGLLDGAAKVFARTPVKDAAPLLDLFPETATDGGALLRMLDAAGAIDAMAAGTLTPPRGLAGWIGRFFHMYNYVSVAYGGVTTQQMPPELFDLVDRIGPRLRETGVPVSMSTGRYSYTYIDADLADALLAAGAGVEGPQHGKIHFWGDKSRRDLIALAADPVLGPRLEGVVHADRDTRSTAIARLPENPGIERAVHARIVALIERVAGGGLLDAELALAELDTVLDQPTAQALDGIEEALAELDGTGPLLHTLHAGIPGEWGWPAWETAIAELGDVHGVTATWPILTLYNAERAVAIDPHGTIARTEFTLPAEASWNVVFFVGGDFLVGHSTGFKRPDLAFWASDPTAVFTPTEANGMTACNNHYDFGYQFATPDGRHDGQRILRAGDRHGIGECRVQLNDGARVWSYGGYREGVNFWAAVDSATGVREETSSLPAFLAATPVQTHQKLSQHMLTYAHLPKGVSSPLGSTAGTTGYRIVQDRQGHTGFALEGVDGRRATYAGGYYTGYPWGIVRMPEHGGDLLMSYESGGWFPLIRAQQGASPLWEVRTLPGSGTTQDDPEQRPFFPPPAFWHFLTPRDAAGSRALRRLDTDGATALLAEGVLPQEITDPGLSDGVRWLAARATRLLADRRRISARVEKFRSGTLVTPTATTPDSDLLPALLGLLDFPSELQPAMLPATLTALAADGHFLTGEIDDADRRLSPPAPAQNWTPLLGHIDAVAWRATTARTPGAQRTALVALLSTWAAQPFAQPSEWRLGFTSFEGGDRTLRYGQAFLQPATVQLPSDATHTRTVTITRDDAARLRQLLELLERNGPRTPSEPAVRLFIEHTGVREPIARLVLDGLPRRDRVGGDYEAHRKMLRTKPYSATKEVTELAERLSDRLGLPGRRRLLAAGMPEDLAELWTADGDLAAAERMAAVWNELIGKRLHVPEDVTAELAAVTDLGTGFATALAHPSASDLATEDMSCVLLSDKYENLQVYRRDPLRRLNYGRWSPYRDLATALAWALTERPVADPGVSGSGDLYLRLQDRLRAPDLLISLGWIDHAPELFGPDTYAAAQTGRVVFDNGLVISDAADRYHTVFLRPAGLFDRDLVARTLRICADHGWDKLTRAIHREEVPVTGLARMIARARTTPVAPGQFEADPRQSVPELVEQVAAATATTPDAAALYLQLLTLARPTDRNVRRWNHWTPARHKKAQAQLVECGLVVTEQRARAGRTAFIPGPWSEQASKPHLPVETSKLSPHLAEFHGDLTGNGIHGPFSSILPPRPLHEMFADAWAARNT